MMRLGFASAAAVSLVLLAPVAALGDGSLSSSENPSTAGDTVTFTAVFYVPCADGVSSKSFSIDGADAGYTTFSGSGQQFTATLTTSALQAGTHSIVFTWSTSMPPGPTCGDSLSLTQTVNAAAPPGQPSAPPPPAEQPSPSRLALMAGTDPTVPVGMIAAASVAAAVVVVLGLAYRRRVR